jgi:hypothetical protein
MHEENIEFSSKIYVEVGKALLFLIELIFCYLLIVIILVAVVLALIFIYQLWGV